MDWTLAVWRSLCLLTSITVLLAVTGILWSLPPLWVGLALTPGTLVTLLVGVASYADSRSGSGR